MNKHLYPVISAYATKSAPVKLAHFHCCQCWNTSLSASPCSHPLFPQKFNKRWWMSMGANFSSMEEFSSIHLLHMHFHVRWHLSRLPLLCYALHGNKIEWNIYRKFQLLQPYHHHLPMMYWANVIKEKVLLLQHPLYIQKLDWRIKTCMCYDSVYLLCLLFIILFIIVSPANPDMHVLVYLLEKNYWTEIGKVSLRIIPHRLMNLH